MEEQLALPMPVIAVQITVRRVPGAGWLVDRRVLRDGQGWALAGRSRTSTRHDAELEAYDMLGSSWSLPPLD